MMNRLYHHYLLWEDYKKGLYDTTKRSEEEENRLANLARNILTNSVLFENIALRVIGEWKHSAEVNLSNPSRNRQAWIGQASCCYAYKIPEYITKLGWHLMTEKEQQEANGVADRVIEEWEKKQTCLKNTSISQFF